VTFQGGVSVSGR